MAQARQCLCFIGSARRPRERRVATTSGLGARATALFASQRAWVRDARASDTRNRRRKRARQMGAASMHQNPLLTLDALAPCGVVLPTEARAALDTSLTLKARGLGVQAFLLWGKFTTSSGRDYYVARAYNGTKRVDGKVIVNPGNKFYYSLDCAEWLDLEPVDGKLGELCGLIDGACRSRVPVRWHRRAIRARRSRPTPPRGASPAAWIAPS